MMSQSYVNTHLAITIIINSDMQFSMTANGYKNYTEFNMMHGSDSPMH